MSIPKIIHQVWVGPKPMSDLMKECVNSWKEKHPDWQHILWDNDKIEGFDFPEKHLLKLRINYGMQSDIIRLAVLREYGGVYADTDMRCIKSFDGLIHLPNHDGFIGKDPYDNNLCNSLIAAKKQAKFLDIMLKKIAKSDLSKDGFKETLDLTGPLFLNQMVRQYFINKVKIFPGKYFNGDKTGSGFYCIHYYTGSWINDIRCVNKNKG